MQHYAHRGLSVSGGGYPPQYFPDGFVELLCNVCQAVPRDAHQMAQCQHTFCEWCLANSSVCPSCRAPKVGVQPNLVVQRAVASAPLKCPACHRSLQLHSIDTHHQVCSQSKPGRVQYGVYVYACWTHSPSALIHCMCSQLPKRAQGTGRRLCICMWRQRSFA